MSDVTDAAVGATVGLMSLGILANVAGNLIKGGKRFEPVKISRVKTHPIKKISWKI